MQEASFHPSIYPDIYPFIQSVNITTTWKRIKAPFSQSWSITTISRVSGFVVQREWLFSLFYAHSYTQSYGAAARLFRVQSLTLLAKGMSNHNCKLVVCPHLWHQHHSHPGLNTSLSLITAAIVFSNKKGGATKESQKPAGI